MANILYTFDLLSVREAHSLDISLSHDMMLSTIRCCIILDDQYLNQRNLSNVSHGGMNNKVLLGLLA